ncbi:MAG: hypothetical protein ACKVRN_10890 [Pyrinomonadaceae bacterium]
MKKQNENTTQNIPNGSEPPAVAGGLIQPSADVRSSTNDGADESMADEVQPPATAGGSDLAQLQAENEQLKATIRLDAAHRQITGELAKAGARSPELLWDALEKNLQFADDGTLQNAAALIQRLRTAHPEQFGFDRQVGSIDAGAGITAAPQLTKDALEKMTAAEIAELDWNDVRSVLAT